ncbi:MAG: hypothetical protein IPP48_06355 [Chitinophagaceae bacterium]|nr:hypothetical protein [Chitinophagaceae bacterium]
MKTLITILLTSIFGNVFSQNPDIKKSWVGNYLEFISIDSQRVNFEVFGNYPKQKKYYLIGDTLRLYDKYSTSRDNFKKQYIKNYDFLITTLTESYLTLIAIDSNSLQLSGGKKKIEYCERHLVEQPKIQFETVKFISTNCYGKCPSLTLQIDKEKRLLFIGRRYAIKQGFYAATLSDSLFQSLIDILELSELDKLKTWKQQVYDAPEYTLEIHYNGKVKYLKNFFLPAVTHELIKYLLEISKKVDLKETKEPFEISFATE